MREEKRPWRMRVRLMRSVGFDWANPKGSLGRTPLAPQVPFGSQLSAPYSEWTSLAMEKTVTVVSKRLVAPITPTSPCHFRLHIFDRAMGHCPFQKRLIFYRTLDPQEAISSLFQASLAKALPHFFNLAGRIRPFDLNKMDLICNDEGVFFSEATTDATLDDLGDFRPSFFTAQLIQTGEYSATQPWTPESPLLFIQITRFACGGISLGFAYAHQMVDGPSIWKFLKAWSEIAREKPLSFRPLITYAGPSRAESSYKSFVDLGFKLKSDVLNVSEPAPSEPVVVRCFNFDRAKINRLKSIGGSNYTSFQIVSAHIWRKICEARCMHPDRTASLAMLINCRGRLPDLPENYFGNAASFTVANTTVGELNVKGLPFATNVVNQTIKNISSDLLQGTLNLLEDLYEHGGKWPDWNFADWTTMAGSHRHPVYDVDFGFGKPVGASYGMDDWQNGKVYLLPGIGGEGIHATIALYPDAMQRLEQDPDFC